MARAISSDAADHALLDSGAGLMLVVEQASESGGTERVVDGILERYPDAEVVALRFCARESAQGAPPSWAGSARLIDSTREKHQFLAPLHARRLRRVQLGSPRVVLSFSSMGWTLGVDVPPGAVHAAYVAGVPRPLYGHTERYLVEERAALRPLLRLAVPALRRYHRRLMRRPGALMANSTEAAAAIRRLMGRDATVVHPPVRTDLFTPGPAPASDCPVLAVARMRPHKRLDVLVDAFRGLDRRLVIAGGGALLDELRATAPPNVRFTGHVTDAELGELYRSSSALVCPSVEEFGIVMGEAHAAGVPVIAPRAGGAVDIVCDGHTGLLLDRMDAQDIASAVRALDVRRFSPQACRASAERFSQQRFAAGLAAFLGSALQTVGSGAGDATPRRRSSILPGPSRSSTAVAAATPAARAASQAPGASSARIAAAHAPGSAGGSTS